jgi:membrane associated rhomboid family serine protease
MFASFKWFRSCNLVYGRLIGTCKCLKSIRWAHGGSTGPEVEFGTKYALKALGFTMLVGCSSFTLAVIINYERQKSVNSIGNNRIEGEEVNKSPSRFQRDPLIQLIKLCWTNLSEMQKVTLGIIGINVYVHLMWMNPRHHNFLLRLFLSSPSTGYVLPMLFCCFSHVEPLHLCINMLVLWKVVPAIEHIMTTEQFVATYISSGE